ncbi:hypothetical protein J7K56_01920, partial [Candidatus Calescamantes bacterium]|nr:hypothetical protein [Candidatus Calescamantes bacterium]
TFGTYDRWLKWKGKKGDKGHKEVKFTLGNKERYQLHFGIYKRGAIVIDNIKIEKIETPLTNSSLWKGLPISVKKKGRDSVFVDPEKVLIGNQFGLYSLEKFKKEIRYFKKYNLGNYVSVGGITQKRIDEQRLMEICQLLKNENLYFMINIGHYPERRSEKEAEIIKKIQKKFGEYFKGVFVVEVGGNQIVRKAYAKHPEKDGVGIADEYIESLRKQFVNFWHKHGIPAIIHDNVLLITYAPLTGCDMPFVEQIYCMTAQVYTAFTRGMAKVYNIPWAADLSIWDGDIEPMQNPEENYLALLSTYFAGARLIQNEHSPWKDSNAEKLELRPWGKALQKFYKIVRKYKEVRGKPLVKIGIVRGYGDGWCDWGGSIWGFRHAEEIEHDWDYLNVFFPGYGSVEGMKKAVVGTPYGQVDVILSNVPEESLNSYDILIFLGPNWMNKPTYEKLKRYVKNGGVLLMHAGQLKDRNNKFFNNGDFSDLFGVKLRDKIIQPHQVYKEKYKLRWYNITQSFCRFTDSTEFNFPARSPDDWWYNMKTTVFKHGYMSKGQIKLYESSLSSADKTKIIAEATGAEVTPNLRKEVYPLVFMTKLGKGKAILVNAPCYANLPARFVEDLLRSIAGSATYPVSFSPRVDYLEWTILENGKVDYLILINMGQKKEALTEVTVDEKFKKISDLTREEEVKSPFLVKLKPLELRIFKIER